MVCIRFYRVEVVTMMNLVDQDRISVVLDKPYRDKSWHTPNKFSVTFFFIIII